MDGLAELLDRASLAGVCLAIDAGRLRARGPRSAESIVQEILARKDEVLPLLYPTMDDLLTAARAMGWPSVTLGRVSVAATEAAWTAVAGRLSAEVRLDAY